MEKKTAKKKATEKKPRGEGRRFKPGENANPYGRRGKPKVDPGTPEDEGDRRLVELMERLLEGPLEAGVRLNVERRLRFVARWCRGNGRNQERMRGWCAKDIRVFVNLFVWQFNPLKLGDEVGPFILRDFQEEALLATPERDGKPGLIWVYEEGQSCVIEKSREMGASWLLLILQDHCCRFRKWQKWLDVSRSEKAVDSPGDSNSLLWKMDFIHEHLPSWLRQERRQGKERRRNQIEYPGTQGAVSGEASTGKAGVGGRCHAAIIDEFSMIEEDKKVRQRTASTARARFFNGTHNGTGTEFFRLTRTPEVAKIVMHWSQHPGKNQGLYSYDVENHRLRFWEYVPREGLKELRGPSYEYPKGFEFDMTGAPTGGPYPGLRSPWYDQQARAIGTARAVAEELDIDPTGSAARPFDPLLIHQLRQYCKPPVWEGELEFDHSGFPVRLIPVKGGALKFWCRFQQDRPVAGTYTAGCDVGAGTGASPSTASIGNARTGEKVARYASAHIKPDQFGLLMGALCRLFSDEHGTGAKIAWEHHGPGVQFGKALLEEAGYRNVYWTAQDETRLRKRQVKATSSPGWRPMGPNKNLLLRDYILALTNREFMNYDDEALAECLDFHYDATGRMKHARDDGDDPDAARENHGDHVIADALNWKLMRDAGTLASKAKQTEPKVDESFSVLTFEGRRRLHEARRREDEWD